MRPSLLPPVPATGQTYPHAPLDLRVFRLEFDRLQRAPVRVGDCLAWPSMFEPPDEYEAWSVADFRRRRLQDNGLLWVDACPAYALALCTSASRNGARGAVARAELDLFWPGLRGYSKLDWTDAAPIVSSAWSALERLGSVRGDGVPAPLPEGQRRAG